MLLWIIPILSIIFIYIKIIKPHEHWKKMKVEYAKPWPLIGNMASFLFRTESMAEFSQGLYNSTSGRYFGFYLFLTPTLLIKDLDLIRRLAIKEFDHFVDHKQFVTTESEPLFGKNLFSLQGKAWRQMRATLSPAFTASKMRGMFTMMSDCADQFTKYFEEIVDTKEPLTVEMKDIFTRYTNDVIASTAFGLQCNSLEDKNNEFYLMGKEASDFSGLRVLKFFGYSICTPLMKFFKVYIFSREVSEFFRSLIKTNIVSREKEGIIRPDMIHLLMEARKGRLRHEKEKDEGAGFATVEESEVGRDIKGKLAQQELSDDDITAQAILFFIAGFDTVSSAMCHMAYELAQQEQVLRRLQDEVDATYEETNGKFTYESVLKMKYMDMVLTETLRKWPALAAVDRICTDSYVLPPENPGESPIYFNKNDVIWFPIYAMHRDPKYFPNPTKFDPERFSDENKDNINAMAYKPFGIGPRNCIGSRFALMEVKIIFCYLLSKFNFVLVEKSEIPLKILKAQFTMNVENGFWLGLQKRTTK